MSDKPILEQKILETEDRVKDLEQLLNATRNYLENLRSAQHIMEELTVTIRSSLQTIGELIGNEVSQGIKQELIQSLGGSLYSDPTPPQNFPPKDDLNPVPPQASVSTPVAIPVAAPLQRCGHSDSGVTIDP
jgi:hypothetical protein